MVASIVGCNRMYLMQPAAISSEMKQIDIDPCKNDPNPHEIGTDPSKIDSELPAIQV